MPEPFDNSVCLTAKQLEAMTGIKSDTFLYWAWRDLQTGPDEPKIGPPSFKIGRRRLWNRSQALEWLDAKQNVGR
jgi:prophage regulatory protein